MSVNDLREFEQYGVLTYALDNGEHCTWEGWLRLCPERRYVKFRRKRNKGAFTLTHIRDVLDFEVAR